MTPILVLLFGVAPTTAVGTDLWFAAITKLFGASVHKKKNSVDWQVVRRLCLGSLPASIVTLVGLYLLGGEKIRDGLILNMLGLVMILTAGALLFKDRLHGIGKHLRQDTPESFKRLQPAMTVVAGAVLGCLVSLTSIGAGALGAVMLLYLYPLRMTSARIVGTDIVHAIPLTIVAGIGHLLLGNVNYGLLLSLLIGSIPGVMLGALLSSRVPETVLRGMLAVVLVGVDWKMLG